MSVLLALAAHNRRQTEHFNRLGRSVSVGQQGGGRGRGGRGGRGLKKGESTVAEEGEEQGEETNEEAE